MEENIDQFKIDEKDSLSSKEPKNPQINISQDLNIPPNNPYEEVKPLPILPMKNIHQFIMTCVKNDEYCYSFIDYMKKFYHFRQIDYYLAYMNILYCFTPINLVEMSKTRKHLKNKYSRDDPGFILILLINLFISSLCFHLATNKFSIFKLFQIFFIQTFFMLFLVGLVIALVSKILMDKYLNCSSSQSIEYTHAFDIHSNSFVVMYLFSVIIPFILLPICSKDDHFIQIFISNILVFYGLLYYFYVSYVEYFSLPFIRKNKKVNIIFWIILGLLFIFNILKINLYKMFLLHVIV